MQLAVKHKRWRNTETKNWRSAACSGCFYSWAAACWPCRLQKVCKLAAYVELWEQYTSLELQSYFICFSSTSSLASTRIRSFILKYFCSQLCCCSCTRRIKSNFYLSDPHPELTNIAELRDVQATRNCRGADDLQSIRPVVFRDLRLRSFELVQGGGSYTMMIYIYIFCKTLPLAGF